jgi:predicted DNA-binding protein YlxM (UPF0122 family)
MIFTTPRKTALLDKKTREDKVKAFYNAGYGMSEIAIKLNIPESVVRQIVKNFNNEKKKNK